MIDGLNLFINFTLFVVIVLLFWDRWEQQERSDKKEKLLLEELSAANKAIIAKNANEYTMMRTMDNVVKEEKQERIEPEFVDEASLEDDEFFETVEKRNDLAKA